MHFLKRYILLLILNFGFIQVYAQQTIQFSQYVFNGLAVNPAYAGYKDNWIVGLSYRMQWTGIDGAPQTGIISIDGLTNNLNKNIGLGLIAGSDRLGPQSTSSIYANYAYRLRLDDYDTRRLSFGFALGFAQYSLDASRFNATNVGDGSIPTSNQSQISPDIHAGLYYYTPKFYLGASVLNMLSGDANGTGYKMAKQVRHVYLTGGMLIPLSEYLNWKPSFMLKEDFKGPTNLDLSSYLLIHRLIWVGASWRTGVSIWNKPNLQDGLDESDAFAAIVQVYCSDKFRIGYSFDFTTSKLADYQKGSHEISIGLTLKPKKRKILSPRYF
jgi:type IX secretion system PorP/SprF family membrane protein